MKSIESRIRAAEKKQEHLPPLNIIGRYYDELTQAEKRRWWKYVYGDAYTTEKAEALEMKYISGTLHFECTLKPGDITFPELEAWEASLERN